MSNSLLPVLLACGDPLCVPLGNPSHGLDLCVEAIYRRSIALGFPGATTYSPQRVWRWGVEMVVIEVERGTVGKCVRSLQQGGEIRRV